MSINSAHVPQNHKRTPRQRNAGNPADGGDVSRPGPLPVRTGAFTTRTGLNGNPGMRGEGSGFSESCISDATSPNRVVIETRPGWGELNAATPDATVVPLPSLTSTLSPLEIGERPCVVSMYFDLFHTVEIVHLPLS